MVMTGTVERGEEVIQHKKILYSVSEAAEVLSIGRTTLYSLIKSGDIESIMVRGRRLIPRESLERYAQRLIRIAREKHQLGAGVLS